MFISIKVFFLALRKDVLRISTFIKFIIKVKRKYTKIFYPRIASENCVHNEE